MPEISEYGSENAILPIADALRGTRDWKDALATALRRGGQNLGIVPTAEKVRLNEEAKSVMPEMADPAKKQLTEEAMGGFGSGGIGKAALVGAIRAGGMPNLYATHSSPIHPKPIAELTSPSFAIKSYKGNEPDLQVPFYGGHDMGGGDGGVLYVPKAGAVDPALRPGTEIYNRDAYTQDSSSRKRGDIGGMHDLRLTHAWADDLRYDPETGQGPAIMASPRFKSAKDYEEHPHGAKLLKGWRPNAEDLSYLDPHIQAAAKATKSYGEPGSFKVFGGANTFEGVDSVQLVQTLRERANAGDEYAAGLLEKISTMPSEYGEAKMRRTFPLNKDTLAGTVLSKDIFAGQPPSVLKNWVAALRDRSIPFEVAGSDEGAAAIKYLSDKAAPFGQ